MSAPLFIGDEVSATGYRLAGMDVRVPAAEETRSLLQWALANASLILLTAEYAARIPAAELTRALISIRPPVLIVPDAAGRVPAPDYGLRLKQALGVLE
jgi:vacuolar-type H+-ATPase subunit F/Vma7